MVAKASNLTAPVFTRRGFFALAAAMGLSAATEGFEGLFVRAWADEAGSTSFRIYVAKRWEVPIAFLDLSKPADPESIVGARITITSHHNGKVATGTTDENGVAFIDISELSEPDPYPEAEVRTEYAFYGSVLVEAAGYRVFETGKMRISGGKQVETPTEKLDGRPYARCATIDGWDIQYAKSTTFAATAANREKHEALFKITDGSIATSAPFANAIDIAFGQVDGRVLSKRASFDANGVATAAFEGAFFSTHADDASSAFSPGVALLLEADIAGDPESSFTMTTSAELAEGVEEKAVIDDNKVFSIDSFIDNGASGEISYKLPDSLPFMGGESVSASGLLPSWPVSFTLDPFGLLIAGVGRAGTLHRHGNAWQRDTYENSLQSYRDTKEEWAKNFNKWKNDRDYARQTGDRYPKVGKLSPATSFDLNFQCGGMIICQWGDSLAGPTGTNGKIDAASSTSPSKPIDSFRGDAQLYAILSGAFTATQQVLVMYVPLFVRFEATAAARAIIDVGVAVQKDSHKLSLSEGSSIAFTLRPEIALTLGVGMADLLSVGIRGAGYLSFYLNVPFQPPEGKPNPRFCIGAGVSASVVVQAALFKASVGLYSMDWPNLYDNWGTSAAVLRSGEGTSPQASPYEYAAYYLNRADGEKGYSALHSSGDSLLQSPSQSVLSFAAQATPVTQAELAVTAEFRASALQPVLQALNEDAGEGERPAGVGGVHELYSYEPIVRSALRSSGSESLGTVQSTCELKALGANGAQMSSGLVYGDAFSDPRMKVVLVGEGKTPWLFRILTTTYGEGNAAFARTRLAVAKWNGTRWDAAQVIDFTPSYGKDADGGVVAGPAREDLFDYDFSVVSAAEVAGLGSAWDDRGAVRIFLTSGTRDGNAGQSMGAALAHTVGTFLSIDEDLAIKTTHSYLDVYNCSSMPDAVSGKYSGILSGYSASTLVFPQIVSDGGSGSNVTAIMAFCRMSATADGLVSGPYVELPVCAIFDSAEGAFTAPDCLACPSPQVSGEVVRAFAAERKLSVSVGIIGRNSNNASTVYLGAHYVTESSSGKVAKEFAIQRLVASNDSTSGLAEQMQLFIYDTSASADFVYPWRGVGLQNVGTANALCAANGRLVSRSFTKEIASATEVVAQTDLTFDKSIDLSSFAIDQTTGMLYYATTREGTVGGDMQDDGTRAASTEVKDYRIWATRCVSAGGKTGFIEPFPLIQTNESIDELTFVPLDGSYAFMVNSITDMTNSKSDIVFYKLPYVRSVRLIDFQSVNQFVCAGEEEAFEIAVCNEGNVAVSGFALLIKATLPDGSAFEEKVSLDLTQTADVIPLAQAEDASSAQADGTQVQSGSSSSACVFTEPKFDLATNAGMLTPGKTRSYRFLWKVPEAMSGATDLEIVVVGNDDTGNAPAVAAGESSLLKGAQTVSQLGEAFAHEPVGFIVDVHAREESGELASAKDSAVVKSRYSYGDGSANGGAGEDSGGGSAIPGGSLANTGDAGLGFAAVATGLAGLGLAGAAYASQKQNRPEEQGDSA